MTTPRLIPNCETILKRGMAAACLIGLLIAAPPRGGVCLGANILLQTDFDSLSNGAVTASTLNTVTSGGTWSLNTSRGANPAIAGGGNNALLFNDHNGGNSGEIEFATLSLNAPQAATQAFTFNFRTDTRHTGANKGLRYELLDSNDDVVVSFQWANAGTIRFVDDNALIGREPFETYGGGYQPTSQHVKDVQVRLDNGTAYVKFGDAYGKTALSGAGDIESLRVSSIFGSNDDRGMRLDAIGATQSARAYEAVPTTLIGPGVRNGDFNADTGTGTRNYSETPFWQNLGSGGGGQEATQSNTDFDGTRNLVVANNTALRMAGQNTEYTIAEGDFFEIGYVWRDAFNWDDANDQVAIRLFTTDDDTIGGTQTTFATLLSGLSEADNTYQEAYGFATAGALEAGRRLFVAIDTQSSSASGFARLDNFTLTVTSIVPEPSTYALGLFALMGLAAVAMRRVSAGGR